PSRQASNDGLSCQRVTTRYSPPASARIRSNEMKPATSAMPPAFFSNACSRWLPYSAGIVSRLIATNMVWCSFCSQPASVEDRQRDERSSWLGPLARSAAGLLDRLLQCSQSALQRLDHGPSVAGRAAPVGPGYRQRAGQHAHGIVV